MIDKSYIFTEFIKGNKIICVDLFLGISLDSSVTILLHIFQIEEI